jgi:hypothetical protein
VVAADVFDVAEVAGAAEVVDGRGARRARCSTGEVVDGRGATGRGGRQRLSAPRSGHGAPRSSTTDAQPLQRLSAAAATVTRWPGLPVGRRWPRWSTRTHNGSQRLSAATVPRPSTTDAQRLSAATVRGARGRRGRWSRCSVVDVAGGRGARRVEVAAAEVVDVAGGRGGRRVPRPPADRRRREGAPLSRGAPHHQHTTPET